jgi:hypothetical protein
VDAANRLIGKAPQRTTKMTFELDGQTELPLTSPKRASLFEGFVAAIANRHVV